ncbi:MAG TPA: hypothetical protein DCE23_04000 [Firmicutes bacterium]|nr:hypothetical protein [Bacillota bacterium]
MLSENLKKYRKEKKLTKMELSRQANVSVRTIEHIEYNKTTNPKIQTLQKLSNTLNVAVEDLLK